VIVNSHLSLCKSEEIFKVPMTTSAGIDRLLHHNVLLKLNISSHPLQESKQQTTQQKA
jgi:hypothetical protein